MKSKYQISAAAVLLAAMVSLTPASATPSRISSSVMDLGEVHRIFVAQGLASVIQLPYPITEVKVGSPEDVQIQISKTLPSELSLILKRLLPQPTNMIVRCGTRTFVFDLIPSRKTHQDLVRISGSYGAPSSVEIGAVLLDSSQKPEHAPSVVREKSDMVLIDSSELRAGKAKGAQQ